MTTDERNLLNAKIAELLHTALVQIRSRTFPPIPGEEPRLEELNDLADLLHNLPRYIVGRDEHAIDSFEQLRAAVVAHVRRFYPNTPPEQHRYVALLDMDADAFASHHRRTTWPEPAGIATS